MDQLRADIALDLLQGKTIEGARSVPTPIMLIVDRVAGHVPGYGTVLPATIAALLEDAKVDVNTDHDCTYQTSSRRPTSAQTRHVTR